MNDEEPSSDNKNLVENLERVGMSRRGFLQGVGGAGAVLGMAGIAGHQAVAETPKDAMGKVIPGFEKNQTDPKIPQYAL